MIDTVRSTGRALRQLCQQAIAEFCDYVGHMTKAGKLKTIAFQATHKGEEAAKLSIRLDDKVMKRVVSRARGGAG